ncbi:copper/zinc superoxide dismutase isoform 2 [Penaeus vannamei]|uniref:Copper/zinc superoxide dismutase isoform 2 n=1 Tax=Penaeus vannamei TaxID=6689 RepID=A0A3R7QDC8_PENVA|nr:copper/zinc superoxide dismutase isoform 2 [Penaeus vannamei]
MNEGITRSQGQGKDGLDDARLITPLLAWALLGSAVGAAAEPAGRHVVYLSQNNYPSLLYINSAHGTASMDHRADTSDIIQLILHPSNPEAKQTRRAAVVLTGDAQGTLTLTQSNPPVGPTVIEGVISNLSPGLHGFHIHQLGDLTGGCASAGGHYNPYMRPTAPPRTARDTSVTSATSWLTRPAGQRSTSLTPW